MSEVCIPEDIHFISLLKACAEQKDLNKGIALHVDINKKWLLANNSYVNTALINMYAKCAALMKAAEVLDEIRVRDCVSWTVLIAGYTQQGKGEKALQCFEQMQHEGLSPDTVSFLSILKACGSNRALHVGEQIHKMIARQGLLRKNVALGTALVGMYAKCGAITKASHMLEELPFRNVVSWSALMTGYVQCGYCEEALKCLQQMENEGICPSPVMFPCILKACGDLGVVDKGEYIHNEIIRQGLLDKDVVLGNALVDMYARCGALAKAAQVCKELSVRDVITWNALIVGYVQQGQGEVALQCLEQMQSEGLSPDSVTFICILKACASIGSLEKGEQIKDEILQQRLLGKNPMLGGALVDFYVKCGELDKAASMLDRLPVRNVVSWSAIIAGYAQQEQGQEALRYFERMWDDGFSPNVVTLTCILKACASVGALDMGEEIHRIIAREGLLGKEVALGNSLVDMYARCGALSKAGCVLDELPVRNNIPWNALVTGYAQKGHGEKAMQCLEQMQSESLSPDASIMTHVLCACSRAGSLNEAITYYTNMGSKFSVFPQIEHHVAMVDLLARAGEFDKAMAVINKMPNLDHLPLWHALLGACSECGNVKLGKFAFDNAVRLGENDAAGYVLMSKAFCSR